MLNKDEMCNIYKSRLALTSKEDEDEISGVGLDTKVQVETGLERIEDCRSRESWKREVMSSL